jgi:alcohol dehydrogenase class IV
VRAGAQRTRERIGLTGGLGGAGVPRGGLDKLAGLAFEDACHRSSARPATRADLLALYQASFA